MRKPSWGKATKLPKLNLKEPKVPQIKIAPIKIRKAKFPVLKFGKI
jgi:hypothetical protein